MSDKIITKPPTPEYEQGWVFGNKKLNAKSLSEAIEEYSKQDKPLGFVPKYFVFD